MPCAYGAVYAIDICHTRIPIYAIIIFSAAKRTFFY